jgi:transposase
VDGSSTRHVSAMDVGLLKLHESEEPPMQTVTTIGLDIAKSVFQVHAVDAAGNVVICRQLKRRYVLAFFEKLSPCLIGIEACASAHHWSRELQTFGHSVRLMPPAYVKPYVKRHKNDATRLMPKRSVRRSLGRTCGSSRPKHQSNRAA